MKSSRFYVTRGTSMLPFFRTGGIVEVSKRSPISLGDVVVVSRSGGLVGHRVINIAGRSPMRYEVKGDTLPHADGWFTQPQILGVVHRVVVNGKFYGLQSFSIRLLRRVAVSFSRRGWFRFPAVVFIVSVVYRIVLLLPIEDRAGGIMFSFKRKEMTP